MATCYLRHSRIPIEEDLTHEFKGHRDLSKLHLSENQIKVGKKRRARSTISKSICSMLNTGLKSTIYLGVTDEGNVEGFMMSLYQRDHFQLALRDLLSKYKPPCPEHVIDIKFIPILDEDEDGNISREPIGFEISRSLDHALHDARYCWCDCYTLNAMNNGYLQRFYVIELTINAWNINDSRNSDLIHTDVCDHRPIFANEYGKIYIRRNGYVCKILSDCDLKKLKNDSYLKMAENPSLEQIKSDSESKDTEYFSFESDSDAYVSN